MFILTNKSLFAITWQTFQIDDSVLRAWLTAVERAYNENPYHSATHAADVLQGTFFHLYRCGLMRQLTDMEVFACVVAAIIHDIGHIGLTNAFLKVTAHPLAIAYNDQSIMENFHASEGWALCVKPDHNIFEHLKVQQLSDIRSLILDMVLDTDMAKHSKNTSHFANKITSVRVICVVVLKSTILGLAFMFF
jgi:hypothetical protein